MLPIPTTGGKIVGNIKRSRSLLTDEELELFLEMSDEEDMISGKSDSESDSDIHECDHSNSDNEELHFDHQGANNNGLHPSSLSPSTSRQSQHSPLHATTTISDNDDASFDHQGATNYLLTPVSASSKTSWQSQSSSPITSLSARARTTPSLVDYSSAVIAVILITNLFLHHRNRFLFA